MKSDSKDNFTTGSSHIFVGNIVRFMIGPLKVGQVKIKKSQPLSPQSKTQNIYMIDTIKKVIGISLGSKNLFCGFYPSGFYKSKRIQILKNSQNFHKL
ncbi:MAG: hypothetical protein ISR95_00690 [Candidatus Marinimicrobia bacterium]|nr:hypothetical protein [Candidatus Neomarinimicrobiota bacterium]